MGLVISAFVVTTTSVVTDGPARENVLQTLIGCTFTAESLAKSVTIRIQHQNQHPNLHLDLLLTLLPSQRLDQLPNQHRRQLLAQIAKTRAATALNEQLLESATLPMIGMLSSKNALCLATSVLVVITTRLVLIGLQTTTVKEIRPG